ncbi:hypothetical protein MHU86_3721 [Fragilaria crotonensis]|nr:hypothetical protein MHU86_3721 [Fragilaria crotonensis]
MNLSLATLILFCVNSASAAISPTRVSYEAVVKHLDADRLLHALQTVGIVSITNVPDLHKQALLQSLPECIKAVGVKTAFADGTVRRTIATHSQGSEMWEATDRRRRIVRLFESQNVAFRAVVRQVVNDFGSFLRMLSLETTLLQHATLKEKSFSHGYRSRG